MGTKEGLRNQEQQAYKNGELSGAGAGNREPDTNQDSIETDDRAINNRFSAGDDDDDSKDLEGDGDELDDDEEEGEDE